MGTSTVAGEVGVAGHLEEGAHFWRGGSGWPLGRTALGGWLLERWEWLAIRKNCLRGLTFREVGVAGH